MSATISIRIPKGLKQKMRENPAQWSEEVRSFIEGRVRNLELQKTLEEIQPKAKRRPVKTDSTALIREDRERRT